MTRLLCGLALASVLALGAGAGSGWAAPFAVSNDAGEFPSPLTDPQPVIMAGAYIDGDPPDSPANRVDPNTVDSPFAGVGSIGVDGVFRATGVAITARHVLTAGHAVDEDHDGVSDVSPERIGFHLNAGGDSTHIIGVNAVVLHPDFTGFDNPALDDDLAILTLDADLPAEVPVYPLCARPMHQGDLLILVGYGRSGWGDLGFRLPLENFNLKRSGRNVADLSFLDDEGRNYPEVYVFDFDGPDSMTNVLGGPSLGNDLETTLGFGDSGGPAFVFEDGQYQLVGINTFIARFTAEQVSPPLFGSAGGGIMLFPEGQWLASETGLSWTVNTLKLVVQGDPVYLRPGDTVTIDMRVLNLAQRIAGCQAVLNFSSTCFEAGSGDVVVAAGGGVWNELIWNQWTAAGDLDVAVGVDLGAGTGTDEDGTVAVFTLTAAAAAPDGVTHMVFRPDVDDIEATYFVDMSALSVYPVKEDSQAIVIDGTDPVVANLAATQDGSNVLGCASRALQGTVEISVDASDALAGLEREPVVTVTQGVESLAVTYVDESPPGTFNYTIEIVAETLNGTWDIEAVATDKAGNSASVAGTLCVNKNRITGTVAIATQDAANPYAFSREVVFKATDGAGPILETWTVMVAFTNDPATQVATGSYTLTDVPDGTANLSGKTAWSLRSRQAVMLGLDGQATADFTLLGGDLDGSNSVNILDFGVLKIHWFTTDPVADITGDGQVQTRDYAVLKSSWFRRGDTE